MDWSLIKADELRAGPNYAADFLHSYQAPGPAMPYPQAPSEAKATIEKLSIDEIAPLKMGKLVVKFGHTTGATVGCVAGLKVDAHLPGSPSESTRYIIRFGGELFTVEG